MGKLIDLSVTQGGHEWDKFSSEKRAMVCSGVKADKTEKTSIGRSLRVIRCDAGGPLFRNLTPGSEHQIVEPPKGQNDTRGNWVMGVGEPVLLLFHEFEYIPAMTQGIAEIAHIARDRRKRQGEQVAKIIMLNDFATIPEGYTGITLRGIPFQIVPDQVLNEVKQECFCGFEEKPESRLLDAFCSDKTEEKFICHGILQAMYGFLKRTYPNL